MKKYLSEILCITSNNNPNRFIDWLLWHACIIKFNHIIIIDNNSTYDIAQICNKINKNYNVNIDCIRVDSQISQMEIYTEYCNKSNAYFFLPIDDDEFLYISEKYHYNINEYLYLIHQKYPTFFKYTFNSYYAFSDNIIKNYIDTPFFNLYDKLYVSNETKTIVNTNLNHYYQPDTVNNVSVQYLDAKFKDINYNISYNDSLIVKTIRKNKTVSGDHLGSPHNPITKLYNVYQHSLDPQNNAIIPGIYNYFIDTNTKINTEAFIYHFKYRTVEEYEYKINNRKKFKDLSIPYEAIYYKSNMFNMEFMKSHIAQKVECGKRLFNTLKIDYDLFK